VGQEQQIGGTRVCPAILARSRQKADRARGLGQPDDRPGSPDPIRLGEAVPARIGAGGHSAVFRQRLDALPAHHYTTAVSQMGRQPASARAIEQRRSQAGMVGTRAIGNGRDRDKINPDGARKPQPV
jgi:hypothetical protein